MLIFSFEKCKMVVYDANLRENWMKGILCTVFATSL